MYIHHKRRRMTQDMYLKYAASRDGYWPFFHSVDLLLYHEFFSIQWAMRKSATFPWHYQSCGTCNIWCTFGSSWALWSGSYSLIHDPMQCCMAEWLGLANYYSCLDKNTVRRRFNEWKTLENDLKVLWMNHSTLDVPNCKHVVKHCNKTFIDLTFEIIST